jgi:WD40 repeat protein
LTGLLFSPDGHLLAAAGDGGKSLGAWDAATGKAVLAATLPADEEVTAILFAPSAPTLLSGHADGSVQVRDLTLASPGWRFQAHVEGILRMALSPDGRTLASTSSTSWMYGETAVRLWDIATGKPLVQNVGPQRAMRYMAISADNQLIATSSNDPILDLWEAASGKHLHSMTAHGPLAFTPDGQTLLCGNGADGKVHFWDVTTGVEVRQFQAHPSGTPPAPHRLYLTGLAMASDGRTLATSGTDHFLRQWDLASEKEIHNFGGKQASAILSITLSPDGKLLASIHEDHSIGVWDMGTGKLLQRPQDVDGINDVAFSPDNKLLASTSVAERAVRLWDLTSGKVIRRLTVAPVISPKSGQLVHADAAMDVIAFSSDGKALFGGTQLHKLVYGWEVSTGKQRFRFQGHQGHITSLAISPDGRMLASGSSDVTALVWDVTGGLVRERTPGPALTGAQLEALWTDLASDQADVAYQAMRTLRQAASEAIPLLRKHVQPVPTADARRLSEWLRDLDSDQFERREKAKQELEKIGEAAEPALRRSLEEQPSAEVRQRVQGLLDGLDLSERLRKSRALEVLEWIGSSEALQLLHGLAEGAPQAWLTQQAKLSLERLARRSAKQ